MNGRKLEKSGLNVRREEWEERKKSDRKEKKTAEKNKNKMEDNKQKKNVIMGNKIKLKTKNKKEIMLS